MLAHELTGLWVEDANENVVPLHFDRAANPTRRCTVISRLHFDATIGMHRALAELVITKRLQGQGQQGWFFFRKHGRHLPFGRTVDAGIGPVCFPLIEISLRLLQTFKALALERRFLGMANSRFHLALSIWIMNSTRQRNYAVVSQDIAEQRIQSGIINVRRQYTFLSCPGPQCVALLLVGGRLSREARPRYANWSGKSASGRPCDCSRASSQTIVCGGTYPSQNRGPWDRTHNQPVLPPRVK